MEKWIKDIYYYHITYSNFRDLNIANTMLHESSPGFYKNADWLFYDPSKLIMSNRLEGEFSIQECINRMGKNGAMG